MARYVIPVYAVIEAPSEAVAKANAAKLEAGLKNPFVPKFLAGQGVKLVEIRVDKDAIAEDE